MSYLKFLFCIVACLCLTCCSAKAQCPSGYVPINFSVPPRMGPPWASGDVDCTAAYDAAVDAIERQLFYCMHASSPYGSPMCTTPGAYASCWTWANTAVDAAYNDYLTCIFKAFPPGPFDSPPATTVCPDGYGCFPSNICANLPVYPPASGSTEFLCYEAYLDALQALCHEYQDAAAECGRTSMWCWDCTCLAVLEDDYVERAILAYTDYIACLPNTEGPPSGD